MKVSYNWLNGYFKKGIFGTKLPKPTALAELLSAHAFEVEGMEKVGSDTVLDIKVLPDRAHYALSHSGIAGEAHAITGAPLRQVKLSDVDFPTDESIVAPKITIAEKTLCRRYVARRIENLTVTVSPAKLKNALESIGARSINTVVDVTNFVMFDLGQPMHAFDADKVKGGIVVRKAKAGEKITILDGREVELRDSDLVIADDLGPLAIAGVKGGKRAEVTSETKNIILESANFEPSTVRRTSTRTNLRNDSSKRFENGMTPSIAFDGMRQATKYILELSAGAKAGPLADVYPSPAEEWTVSVNPTYMNAVTGLDLSVDEMIDLLKKIECKVEIKAQKGAATLEVTPPLNRLDIMIPEDVADELVRLYGYDALGSKETPVLPPLMPDKTFYWSEAIKTELRDLGYSEGLLYSLVPKGEFEIAYPLSADKAALREKLSPKLKEALVMNARNAELLGLEAIKMFEIGKTFSKAGEKTMLSIGALQAKKKKGVTADSTVKATLAALSQKFGVAFDAPIETGEFGAVAELDLDTIIAALPGERPLADLAFSALPKEKRYTPFSAYPYIVRDVALFVPSGTDESTVVGTVADAARTAAGKLLVKGPDLFDRFEKTGRVSYAFRMIFQSFEKTLSDDEANAFMTAIHGALKAKGWEVR